MIEILTFETPGLGDRSYIVHDGAAAVVIDPQRDIDRFLAAVDARALTVALVVETHIHNDYVSGGLELARVTGAAYVVPVGDDLHFDALRVNDGDELSAGTMTVRALHTPGHTPTHMSYVVADGERDHAVFTGGSLLYGTVGRTDLISRSATDELTRAQLHSARRLASELADHVLVQPTHGFGSFCSSAASDENTTSAVDEHPPTSTIAAERAGNIALTITDEQAFVDLLLAGLDAYPRYYAHMGPSNRLGAAGIDLSPPVPADPTELAARIHAGEWVVDLRDRIAFAGDHVRGTINIEGRGQLATYLGWLIPWGRPFTLLADSAEEIAQAQRELVRIGLDRPAAAAHGGVERFGAGADRETYPAVPFTALAKAIANDEHPVVVDARRAHEHVGGHLPGALHIPLHELERRMAEVPHGEVWVHCEGGFRASIAASLLARAGRRPVLIDDVFAHAADAGLEVVTD